MGIAKEINIKKGITTSSMGPNPNMAKSSRTGKNRFRVHDLLRAMPYEFP